MWSNLSLHQHISLVTLDLLSEAAEDFPSSILGFPNPTPPVFAAPALSAAGQTPWNRSAVSVTKMGYQKLWVSPNIDLNTHTHSSHAVTYYVSIASKVNAVWIPCVCFLYAGNLSLHAELLWVFSAFAVLTHVLFFDACHLFVFSKFSAFSEPLHLLVPDLQEVSNFSGLQHSCGVQSSKCQF